jgi:hypothetical protein
MDMHDVPILFAWIWTEGDRTLAMSRSWRDRTLGVSAEDWDGGGGYRLGREKKRNQPVRWRYVVLCDLVGG